MPTDGFELRAVRFQYGETVVLDEITLRLPAGARTAILGPSGAGKSTLLRLLAGLEAPSHGEILLDGVIASRPRHILVPPHRRAVAMVFQDLALWPNLSALDNVALGLSGSAFSAAGRRTRARAALDEVRLGGLADRRPATLSGGEQQRVALARALAVDPAYLLLDEPFASIDLPTKTRLLADIDDQAVRHGFAVLLVTHDPLEAQALCDEAIVLEQGRVSDCGALQALLNGEPLSETLRAFRAQVGAQVGMMHRPR